MKVIKNRVSKNDTKIDKLINKSHWMILETTTKIL